MSNGLTPQVSDDQDVFWQAMRDRHRAVSYYKRTPPTDQSNVMPPAISACWYLLRQSHLSEEAFKRLVSAASNRVTQSGKGLRPLDAKSLATFLHFCGAIRTIAAEPEIAISPKGNIQAEWTKDEDDFLVLEFQPRGEIFFSLWQSGFPTEGVKSAKLTHELVNMFDAMDENPLRWSDAA